MKDRFPADDEHRESRTISTNKEQDPCNYCGKTIREQMKGCSEVACYRQFLPKLELNGNSQT